MSQTGSFAEEFVLMSAPSNVRVKAIADAVEDALQKKGHRVHHREGYHEGMWVLLDYGDVLVHIFHESLRIYYGLEKLWGDVPKRKFFPVKGNAK